MKILSISKIAFVVVLAAIGCFVTMAFQDSSKQQSKQPFSRLDTVPARQYNIELDMKDFDKTMEHLDVELKNLGNKLKEVDYQKISKQIQETMKDIDLGKIKLEIEQSMKNVDFDKVKSEIERSMKEIDHEKINAEVEKAIKGAVAAINMDEIKKSIEELKTVNSEELKRELNNAKEEIEKNKDAIKSELEKARAEMKVSKSKLSDINNVTSEMEKDGLINSNEEYTIEYRNKTLTINGKKQSQNVTDKYNKYFNGEDFRIHKSKSN